MLMTIKPRYTVRQQQQPPITKSCPGLFDTSKQQLEDWDAERVTAMTAAHIAAIAAKPCELIESVSLLKDESNPNP